MQISYTNQIQLPFISLFLTTPKSLAYPSVTPVILYCFQFDFFVLKKGHKVFVILWLTYFIKKNVLQLQPVCKKWRIWFFFIIEQCAHTCLHISVWVCMCHKARVQLAEVHSSHLPCVFTVLNSGHQGRTFTCWTRYGLYMAFFARF